MNVGNDILLPRVKMAIIKEHLRKLGSNGGKVRSQAQQDACLTNIRRYNEAEAMRQAITRATAKGKTK